MDKVFKILNYNIFNNEKLLFNSMLTSEIKKLGVQYMFKL